MKIMQIIDVYNGERLADRGRSVPADNFQFEFRQRLDETEKIFDELVAGLQVADEGAGGDYLTYQAVPLGRFAVEGATEPVVAQPLRKLKHPKTNRITREIELFMADPLLTYYGRMATKLGGARLDSGRSRALPLTVAMHDQFRELLDEVFLLANDTEATA